MSGVKVLYIEDNDAKFDDVANGLGAPSDLVSTIDRATNLVEAVERLKAEHYDLVILDVRIPYAAGRPPQREVSEDIVAMITSGETFNPSYVIGLTEYPEELATDKSYPIEYFTIEAYSSVDRNWLPRLQRHISHIMSSKQAALSFHHHSFDFDIAIVCARSENEFKVVDREIRWEEGTRQTVSLFTANKCVTGVWNTRGGMALRVALICLERTGLSSAASITSAAIAYFRPRVVAMLGMCCGLNHNDSTDQQALGDVLIMSETFCWDEGRYSERDSAKEDLMFFEARPSSGNMSPALRKAAEQMVETDRKSIETLLTKAYTQKRNTKEILAAGKVVPGSPRVRVGLNVSGSSVVAAREQTAEILSRFPGALGLEMECHAIYSACYLTPGEGPQGVCIKGIADFGDGKKAKEHQKLATLGSFVVFQALVDKVFSAA